MNKILHCLIWQNQAQKCHDSFQNPGIFRINKITRRCQKGLVESNFEIYQKLNQQSELSNGRPEIYPVKPCMHIYKVNIQSYGSLDRLKLRIGVRGDWKNK